MHALIVFYFALSDNEKEMRIRKRDTKNIEDVFASATRLTVDDNAKLNAQNERNVRAVSAKKT